MIDKRRYEPRLAAHMAAKIVAPGQVSPAPCVVREISPAGAKLHMDTGWILPRNFWLRIEGDNSMHFCIIAWRQGENLGVDFPTARDSSWWTHSVSLNRGLPSRARF
jgi:hypothetical protein